MYKKYPINFTIKSKYKFLFVIATDKKEEEFEDMPIYKTIGTKMKISQDYYVDFVIFFENKLGLSKVYNSVLTNSELNQYDFIIFLHDDLWINDVLIFEKLISVYKDYDLIGICGGKTWKINSSPDNPIIWNIASKDYGVSGYMIHAADKSKLKNCNSTLFDGKVLFATSYGDTPSPVLTIDGCFMCLTQNAIKNNLMFDEVFDFHYYDIDLSFTAFSKKLRTGTCGVIATHYSLGEGVLSKEFMIAQKVFLNKWYKMK